MSVILNKFLTFIVTVSIWLYTIGAFLIATLFSYSLMYLFKRPFSASMALSRKLVRVAFYWFRFDVRIVNIERIPGDKPFIIISNHQSLLDIVAYVDKFPRNIIFLAKKELTRVPLLSHLLRAQGHLVIDRGDPKSAYRVLEKAMPRMKEDHQALIIFAEGTRSVDETIGPFKRGAFKMAMKTGFYLLPCYVAGTGKCMQKKSLWIRPGRIQIFVGELVDVAPFGDPEEKDDVEGLREFVQDKILGLQAAEQGKRD